MIAPFKSQLAHGAFELLRRAAGFCGAMAARPEKRSGRLRIASAKLVVERRGQRRSRLGVENLHARIRQRKNLAGDSGRVHVADALLAQVLQPRNDSLSRADYRPENIPIARRIPHQDSRPFSSMRLPALH